MAASGEHLRGWNAQDGGDRVTRLDWQVHQSPGMTAEEFARFQAAIFRHAAVWLGREKREQFSAFAAQRQRALGLAGLNEYFTFITAPEQSEEFALLVEAVSAGETLFFSEPRHYEFLAQRLFPRWRQEAADRQRPRHLRLWSSGCASGEEAYSLAMMLLQNFPAASGWTVEVLATDIRARLLERARHGIYSSDKAKEIPKELLQRYMLKGGIAPGQAGFMKAGDELLETVRFASVDLNAASFPFAGVFDLIVCRHVLTHFDPESKRRALGKMVSHLSPSGFLLAGEADDFEGWTPRLRRLAPTIYGQVNENGRFLSDFRSPRN